MSVLGSLYGSISIDMVIACLYYHYHFPVDIPGSDNTFPRSPPSCRQLAYHPPHACGRDRLQSTYAPPSTRPDAAGPSDGEAVISTNRAKDRADAQRLVTTRLLDRLHDPLGHFSRLQRIYPRAW
ncbi:hypothetical protein VTN49DRAFT_6361 [Thermomyces lanuginosus]|uniref:uncharacterized protein n=1 Tax=Thermomyces lanuginosus TaxID=5541 RepID=UPI00374311DD